MKMVKFTGKFAELKSLGYTVQSLFAANYQQWYKDDYRVWKRGSELTHDSLGHYFPFIVDIILTLDMNNLPFVESRFVKDQFYLYVYIHRETNTCTFDQTDWVLGMKREVDSYRQDDDQKYWNNTWKKVILNKTSLEPLLELYNKGWIEVIDD